MNKMMQEWKSSFDEQWAAIEAENDFEKRLYATDPHCLYDDEPGFRYKFKPVFVEFPIRNG